MGKFANNKYYPSEKELDELAERNNKAVVNKDLLQKAVERERKMRTAQQLCRESDRKLPRYYDYTTSGKLRRTR